MTKKTVLKRGIAAVALTLAANQMVAAQELGGEPAMQKVLVTGSNIKRSDKEGTSPVQTVSAKQIAATGASTVAELLRSIPAFGTGAALDTTDGGFSNGASTASLRGLGSSATLILLNGRRITASAYADPNQGKSAVYDLNTIPISAIERVEIFKDGASAVYGSDAIAGVINFITKTDYQGAQLGASTTFNDDGQFRRHNANGIFGIGDLQKDHYNAFISFDVAKRDSTLIKDANDVEKAMYADINGRLNPFSSSLSAQPFFYRERTPGAKNFSNTYALRADVINRSNCDPSQLITGDRALHNLNASYTLIGRTFCNFNLDNYREAQGAGEDANILSKLTFQLNPNLTAFVEAGYSRTERTYLGVPIATRGTASTTVFALDGSPAPFQLILPVGHPDNPFPASRAAVGYRFVNSSGNTNNINEAYRLVGGVKGTAGSWDWETAALWNRSEREETTFGRLYRPTVERIMTEGRTLAQTAADPTVTHDVVNHGYAQVAQVDAKASTAFGHLGGGEIGLAVGAEFREEKVGLTPDEVLQRGDIVGLANSSADGSRKVKSAFVELRTPFAKNFEMDFAGRYDKYPTFKGNFVPKVGVKWTVSDRVTLRSSYAEGFRAPALTQVSPGGVQSFTTVIDSLRCPDGVTPADGADKLDCSKGISSLSAANPALKPEKSKSLSFGLILAPTKDIDVLIDYYRIKKVDETALLSAQSVIDHADQYSGLLVRDQNPANWITDENGNLVANSGPILQVNRSYVNQGSTEVSGVDVDVTWRKALGEYGKLTTTLNWSYLLEYRRAEAPGDVAANVAGYSGGLSDWATSSDDMPKNRFNLAASWAMGDHTVTASADFVGPVSLLRRSENADVYAAPYCHYGVGQPSTAYSLGGLPKFSNYISSCDVKSWTTYGLGYAYTGIKNLTLSLNIKNLFDTRAPYDPRFPVEGFNTDLHNGEGRYFGLSMNYKFM